MPGSRTTTSTSTSTSTSPRTSTTDRIGSIWSEARERALRSRGVDRAAVKSAARAAIVITVVFAFADKVIGNPTTALFATFGSFALLVLAQFTGPLRTRLLAYLALGCAGALFITLGTLRSRSLWLSPPA